MPIADSQQRCQNKQDILLDILYVAGLPISPKCQNIVSQTGTLIGLHWTVDGHCLSDSAVESLVTALSLIPKTATDAKAIIGLINYSESAFTYSPHEQSRHGTLMAILSDAVNAESRLNWSDSAQLAVKELALRMQNLPRVAYDPVHLFSTNQYIIVILGDASKTGAGSSIYLVKKKCAEDFVKSDLTASDTLLVDVFHKVLSSAQCKWQTYETESWIMVKSVKKWSKYIARALYTRSHWDCNKILMLSDSTTAASKWFKIHLPQHDLDFICAKARRFLSWSDKVAYTADWPMITNHLPGEYNSLSHLLSHIGDLLTDMYTNPIPRPAKPSPSSAPPKIREVWRTPDDPLYEPPSVTPSKKRVSLQYVSPEQSQFDPLHLSNTEKKRSGSPVTVPNATSLFVSLHSYHGNRPLICDDYNDPPGFVTLHLNIPVESCAIMASAYFADTNPFHKVHLKHVYQVATNDFKDIDKVVKERIMSWIGKIIFPICPPGSPIPLLYTPASCKLMRWGDPFVLANDERLDLKLVPVIPDKCKIKLTDLTPIAHDHDDSTHEQYRDLRHEILSSAHTLVSPHNSKAKTSLNVRRIAIWPGMEDDVAYFVKTCSSCLPERNPLVRLGATLMSTRRMGVLMIDKLVFDKDIFDITGIPAALIMTCPCIGDSLPALVESMTAVEAARVIFCYAIPRYSIPYCIVSDSEPAFASQVCKELAKMMGVPKWDYGPVTSPQHHAKVEVRMKPYNRALDQATNNGRIKCRRTLEVVLASACITHTQHMITYGSTAFTRLTGSIPRTVNDLFSSAVSPDIDFKDVTSSDEHVISALTDRVEALCDWHQEKRDAAHRHSLYSKMAKDYNARVTDFYFLVGDMVSYKGERWKLISMLGPPNQPISAVIQKATHADTVQTKTVRYDTLQNLSAAREQLDLHVDVLPKLNDYVFFTTKDGLTCSGMITQVNTTDISVHAYDPSPQIQSFLPNWIRGDRNKSQTKQPRGYAPDLVTTTFDSIELLTKLNDTGRVPNYALKLLLAKGVVMPWEFNPDADSPARSSAILTNSEAKQRLPRRSTFHVSNTQHQWIIQQLRILQSTVTHDPFQDHALLLQIIMRGTQSTPASSVIDANELMIQHAVPDHQAELECATNQIYRIRLIMLSSPHKQWILPTPAGFSRTPRYMFTFVMHLKSYYFSQWCKVTKHPISRIFSANWAPEPATGAHNSHKEFLRSQSRVFKPATRANNTDKKFSQSHAHKHNNRAKPLQSVHKHKGKSKARHVLKPSAPVCFTNATNATGISHCAVSTISPQHIESGPSISHTYWATHLAHQLAACDHPNHVAVTAIMLLLFSFTGAVAVFNAMLAKMFNV